MRQTCVFAPARSSMQTRLYENLHKGVTIFNLRGAAQKLAPERIYFGAISEKISRQIEKVLARVSLSFRRRIFRDFGL
ncbi:hypothetical protein [Porphyromonas loveana]|uniref:hypothetical protein n=1 Tax=Porphyromonas loveana TaxID=1884669 RepID=UPI0035A04BED